MKLVKENINDILKPKNFIKSLDEYLPDIKENNKLINYYFKGDISKIQNVSEYTYDVIKSKGIEIKTIILELRQLSEILNMHDLTYYIDNTSAKYVDFILTFIKEKCYVNHKTAINFLKSDFLKICKTYFDDLNIDMINPNFTVNDLIQFKLSQKINEDQTYQLYKLIEKSTNYQFYVTINGNEFIYPNIKH